MTKSGGKSQVDFRVMQNLLTRLDSSLSSRVESSHFSSWGITRSIPSTYSWLQQQQQQGGQPGAVTWDVIFFPKKNNNSSKRSEAWSRAGHLRIRDRKYVCINLMQRYTELFGHRKSVNTITWFSLCRQAQNANESASSLSLNHAQLRKHPSCNTIRSSFLFNNWLWEERTTTKWEWKLAERLH